MINLLEQRPARWERVFFVVAMSAYIGSAFIVDDQPQGDDALNPLKALTSMTDEGDPVKQLFMIILYAAFLLVALRTMRWQTWSFLGVPMIGLMGWILLSPLWSIDPTVSFRRAIAMVGTVVLGSYMGLRFDVRAMIRLMCVVLAVILAWSLIVTWIWPSAGLDFEYRFRGVTPHKNAMAGFLSIGFLAVITEITMIKQKDALLTLWYIVLAAVTFVCLVWADSAGAVPVLIAAVPVLPLTCMFRKADKSVTAALPLAIGISAVLFVVIYLNYDMVVESLGRSKDLSGRTWIWQYSIDMFLESPYLGYGFSAFWQGYNGPGGIFWTLTHLGAPHSHNGFIQLSLDTGIPGLMLFGSCLFILFYRLGWLVRYGNDRLIAFSVAFLVLYLASNIAETRLFLVGNQPFSELFIYIVVSTNLEIWRTLCNRQVIQYRYLQKGAA